MKPFVLKPLDLTWKTMFRIPDSVKKELMGQSGKTISNNWQPGKSHIDASVFTVTNVPCSLNGMELPK